MEGVRRSESRLAASFVFFERIKYRQRDKVPILLGQKEK
jgi:hypothetical protein